GTLAPGTAADSQRRMPVVAGLREARRHCPSTPAADVRTSAHRTSGYQNAIERRWRSPPVLAYRARTAPAPDPRRAGRGASRTRSGAVATTSRVQPDEGASSGTEGVFDREGGHEQVVFCQDPPTGLRAIIAVHSTVLGPALGGVRFHPYGSEQH